MQRPKKFQNYNSNIAIIGLSGLLLGMSTCILYPHLALFLKSEFGLQESKIALLDGVVEAIAYVCRILSGSLSDVFANRKIVVLCGMVFAVIGRPIICIATSVWHVTFSLILERLSNGIVASPRDALLADSVSSSMRGKAYGFVRSLKTFGGFLGTLIGTELLVFYGFSYRSVFVFGAVLVSVAFCLMFFLRQPKISDESQDCVDSQECECADNDSGVVSVCEQKKSVWIALQELFSWQMLRGLGKTYWTVVLFTMIVQMAHFSETLLICRANDFLLSARSAYVSSAIAVGQFLLTFPLGMLSDIRNKRSILLICFSMMFFANLCFYVAWIHPCLLFLGAFLWGGQMNSTESVMLSIISSSVPEKLRGTAIGIFYATVGLSFLLSSTIAGLIRNVSQDMVFVYSMSIVALSIVLMLAYPRNVFETREA